MEQRAQLGRTYFLWIDLEMTGLDPAHDRILEFAAILTDDTLQTIADGPSVIVYQPDSVLQSASAWVHEHLGKNGLLAAMSAAIYTEADVEQFARTFLDAHVTCDDTIILAGNSVHQDQRFIRGYMPQLYQRLSYRIIDVSTIKLLVRSWYPDEDRKSVV